MHKVPVGILGASGYAGRELLALVERHPRLTLAFAAAHSRSGERAAAGARAVTFAATEDAPLGDAALVFSALPHGESAPWVARAEAAGAKVVDLSADLRPGAGAAESAVPYGLTEIARDRVRAAQVVANPGCYATAALLALAPLALRGLLAPGEAITINAASGVTGAGSAPRPGLLFAEVAEDFRAYALGNSHRHAAEMRAVLGALGADVDLIFTPHLLPVSRGILATIAAPVTRVPTEVLAPWRAQYRGEPFIEITDDPPALRDVVRRNAMRLTARVLAGTRRPTLQLVVAIDNLVKGAAGQAMQNANLLLGLDETLGAAGVTRVIKVGGRVQEDPALPRALARAWEESAGAICVVHGGGDAVSALQRALGRAPAFIDGRRVTRDDDIELVRMAVSGAANKRLVSQLAGVGVAAVGISGEDGALIGARAIDAERLGRAGTPRIVRDALLRHLLDGGFLPVISPLARDLDRPDGAALNVNADDAAAAIALALHATELLLVSDVDGVLLDGAPARTLDADEASAAVASGAAHGGMAAKVEAALRAVASGVDVVRIGGIGMLLGGAPGTAITRAPVAA